MSEFITTNAPDSPNWTRNSCFGPFHSVGVLLGSFHYCLKLGAKLSKLVQPDPPHWTLNTCFGAFRSVWVHLGSFHNCMKLGAKWAEHVQLMQKFVTWIRVAIFHIERTQSNPLDHKPPFWCVLQCVDAFGIISLLPEIWCKTSWTGAINAKVHAMKACQNYLQLMHLFHLTGP